MGQTLFYAGSGRPNGKRTAPSAGITGSPCIPNVRINAHLGKDGSSRLRKKKHAETKAFMRKPERITAAILSLLFRYGSVKISKQPNLFLWHDQLALYQIPWPKGYSHRARYAKPSSSYFRKNHWFSADRGLEMWSDSLGAVIEITALIAVTAIALLVLYRRCF